MFHSLSRIARTALLTTMLHKHFYSSFCIVSICYHRTDRSASYLINGIRVLFMRISPTMKGLLSKRRTSVSPSFVPQSSSRLCFRLIDDNHNYKINDWQPLIHHSLRNKNYSLKCLFGRCQCKTWNESWTPGLEKYLNIPVGSEFWFLCHKHISSINRIRFKSSF